MGCVEKQEFVQKAWETQELPVMKSKQDDTPDGTFCAEKTFNLFVVNPTIQATHTRNEEAFERLNCICTPGSSCHGRRKKDFCLFREVRRTLFQMHCCSHVGCSDFKCVLQWGTDCS